MKKITTPVVVDWFETDYREDGELSIDDEGRLFTIDCLKEGALINRISLPRYTVEIAIDMKRRMIPGTLTDRKGNMSDRMIHVLAHENIVTFHYIDEFDEQTMIKVGLDAVRSAIAR